jgi:hypothetical protein
MRDIQGTKLAPRLEGRGVDLRWSDKIEDVSQSECELASTSTAIRILRLDLCAGPPLSSLVSRLSFSCLPWRFTLVDNSR